MKEQKKVVRWIKEHKKELIVAGVSITGLIGTILVIRNREALRAHWAALVKMASKSSEAEGAVKVVESAAEAIGEVVKTATETTEVKATTLKANIIPFEVVTHLRKLPEGWQASPFKMATAPEEGIDLMDGYTWVKGYVKGVTA